ncbi:DUF7471 family protein [Haloarcula marina]|uniref:DUF7471 family protein n=1 Tax=Haloarcula marina TaxID=2961574 RepID=UPI0020B88CC8|nr:hypothetical protein [Halomicroarcula marina]
MNRALHIGVHVGELHVDFAALLAVSAVATAALCALGVGVYRRRGSRSYLLVALALGALAIRPLLGGLAMVGVVGPEAHHTLEHGADALLVVLVLGAVYYARTVEKQLESEEEDV